MPTPTAPPVVPQDLLDNTKLMHEGGHYPYTAPYWGSYGGPSFSYVATHEYTQTPGPTDWVTNYAGGLAGMHPWYELTTEEGSPTNLDAKVEMSRIGLAVHRKSTNRWDVIYATGSYVPQAWSWSDAHGYLPDVKTAAGDRVMGLGLGNFAQAINEPTIGGNGRIRAHGWSEAGWDNGRNYFRNDPAIARDVDAVVSWVTVRVTGADAARSQYRIMPGFDLMKKGTDVPSPPPGSWPGMQGRARKITAAWQTFTVSTMSTSMVATLPPPPIPGYATTSVPPVVVPPPPAPLPPTGPAPTPVPTPPLATVRTVRADLLNGGTVIASSATKTVPATAVITTKLVETITQTAPAKTGKLVIIGDQWLARYRDTGGLAAKLTAAGWKAGNVTIDARANRSAANGLATIANMEATIAAADTVVLTLGINKEWNGLAEPFPAKYQSVASYVHLPATGYLYTQAEYAAIIAATVLMIRGINPRCRIVWADLPDTTWAGFNAALHAATGVEVAKGTATPALWTTPAWYDAAYLPTPVLSSDVAARLTAAIGPPGV